MKRVLVTGANGFVGRRLCADLALAGWNVVAAVRRADARVDAGEKVMVGDIGPETEWSAALSGADVVVHTAARVHELKDTAANAAAYFECNEAGTVRLASCASRAGVRRLVFLSSIKVNGERTTVQPFTARDSPRPLDAYGASKWAAERQLTEFSARTGMEVVTVRTPLVYGPGVRANFLRLLRWIHTRRPLPFGLIDNRRSMTALGNLSSLLVDVTRNPAAANRTLLVSDGEDLSTRDLAVRLASALDVKANLLPVPAALLRLGGLLSGRSAEVGRLCDSLAVDSSDTREILGWRPPLRVDAAFAETARWFLETEAGHAP